MQASSKLHKDWTPFRLVECTQTSPYRRMTRWFADILNTVREMISPPRAKDLFRLATTLKNLQLISQKDVFYWLGLIIHRTCFHGTSDILCTLIFSTNVHLSVFFDHLGYLDNLSTCNICFDFEANSQQEIVHYSPETWLTCLRPHLITLSKRYLTNIFLVPFYLYRPRLTYRHCAKYQILFLALVSISGAKLNRFFGHQTFETIK